MGKPAQRRPGKKGSTANDFDLLGEDGWIIVKKQRVTILIPPKQRTKKSTLPMPGPMEVEAIPTKTVNTQLSVHIESSERTPPVDVQEMAIPVASSRIIKMVSKPPPRDFSEVHKLPNQNVTIVSEHPKRVDTFTPRNTLGVSHIPKKIKQPRQFHGPGSFLYGSTLLNPGLRASLLEKKLQKAGGLSKWLASLGLGRFVRIFRGNSVGKFQLANLTMKKLKDMGANAVGPRRKLMHAIDCICQPYCFEARYTPI